jgi:hypothetical protein
VVAQMRTNLPLIFERVWPNGNGNVGHTTMGVGGSRSWCVYMPLGKKGRL